MEIRYAIPAFAFAIFMALAELIGDYNVYFILGFIFAVLYAIYLAKWEQKFKSPL